MSKAPAPPDDDTEEIAALRARFEAARDRANGRLALATALLKAGRSEEGIDLLRPLVGQEPVNWAANAPVLQRSDDPALRRLAADALMRTSQDAPMRLWACRALDHAALVRRHPQDWAPVQRALTAGLDAPPLQAALEALHGFLCRVDAARRDQAPRAAGISRWNRTNRSCARSTGWPGSILRAWR